MKRYFNISILNITALLIFSFLMSVYDLSGQRNLKYKDVYKIVTEKSREEAYSLLLVYQKQDPFSANTYLQLGLISQFWSKDYDALTNLKDVEFFIYNTNLYYGLALSKIDQKEVRKSEKYFQNIDRFRNSENIDPEAIKIFIQEQLDANIEYKKNVQIVTNYFNLSILHYNNCIRIFKEINTANNKIKDIYLTSGKEFLENLDELEKSFDSTIFYLQNYQTAIKNYPIKNYNQKYKLLPIETYRLQGLTGSDFLQDEIPIWDYRTWVKNVKQILVADIAYLRTLINKADEKLNQEITSLNEQKENKPDIKSMMVDDKLKFKIGKFDHKSLVLELFKYKESKIDYLNTFRDPLNNPFDSLSGYSYPQKARYYELLLSKKQTCDSLNKNLASQINSYDINKYRDFFTNNYGGEVGLKDYLTKENESSSELLKKSLDQFKDYLITAERNKLKPDTLIYRNSKIGLKASRPETTLLKTGKYHTSDIQKNSAGDYYITGYTKLENGKISAFLAKTNKLESIKWLQLIVPEKQEQNFGTFLAVKEEGCEVLVNVLDSPLITNKLIVYDLEGKQKEKVEIPVYSCPRSFTYDEINQKYTIIFKGTKPSVSLGFSDDLYVCQFDALTRQIVWMNSIKIKGLFVDMIKMDQDIFIFSNFTEYQSADKNIISKAGTSDENTNLMLLVVDESGKLKNEIPVLSSNSYYVAKIIKNSSNSINLLGFKNSVPGDPYQGDFLYMLMNSKGVVYYDNWQ
ncbi:MAG: hypothetical protein U0W24_03470 [Bacteroidales bacterium]